MKQLFTTLLILCSLSATAQKKPRIDSIAPGIIIDSNKVAQVDLTKYMLIDTTGQLYVLAPVQVWQQLLDALDKSGAPHTLIVELNKFIIDQLQSQGRRKR